LGLESHCENALNVKKLDAYRNEVQNLRIDVGTLSRQVALFQTTIRNQHSEVMAKIEVDRKIAEIKDRRLG
jgi:hypothetical protein